jgi:hypothetical protein
MGRHLHIAVACVCSHDVVYDTCWQKWQWHHANDMRFCLLRGYSPSPSQKEAWKFWTLIPSFNKCCIHATGPGRKNSFNFFLKIPLGTWIQVLFLLLYTNPLSRQCVRLIDDECIVKHLHRKVWPHTSAWYSLHVEATRRNMILPDLPVRMPYR